MKKIISMFFAATLMLAVMPSAFAAEVPATGVQLPTVSSTQTEVIVNTDEIGTILVVEDNLIPISSAPAVLFAAQ